MNIKKFKYDDKVQRLRLLIEGSKQDVLAGTVTEYQNANDMTEKIIQRRTARYKENNS